MTTHDVFNQTPTLAGYNPFLRDVALQEKQGGSDVRANTTCAESIGGRAYRITGHKWFFSAPMCDAFLVLAQAPRGLLCFLLPRLALAMQAALLVRFAPSFVSDAFCASRLAPGAFAGGAFGAASLSRAGEIVDRAWPQDNPR